MLSVWPSTLAERPPADPAFWQKMTVVILIWVQEKFSPIISRLVDVNVLFTFFCVCSSITHWSWPSHSHEIVQCGNDKQLNFWWGHLAEKMTLASSCSELYILSCFSHTAIRSLLPNNCCSLPPLIGKQHRLWQRFRPIDRQFGNRWPLHHSSSWSS